MIQVETLDLLEWSRLCQHLATFAATKLGAFAARHLHPPENLETSLDLLSQTQEVYQLEVLSLKSLSFTGIKDIGASLERAELGGILSGDELTDLATTLAGMRRLRRLIDAQEEVPKLQALVAQVRTYPELEQEIHRCIDDRGKVADRANAKLSGIRQNIKTVRDKIYQILQRIMQKNGGALQESLITQRSDRFVLPVKAPQKETIPGVVHDASSTGATLYIEPQSVINWGNQLRQYQRQEQREEEAILQALTEQVEAVREDLEQLLAIATTLDLATAKARYSYWLEANPPRFIDYAAGEAITLRQLRHPLLVWQQKHEQGVEVVPINVQIRPQIRVVAITGPNTGGKTVTLKTLGLAVLMAKVGLFVPAKEPVELPWFEQILADIGDEQSIEQSLSTFSGHIRRISRIISVVNPQPLVISEEDNVESDHTLPENSPDSDHGQCPVPNSQFLVLLDEVGAGTDPTEGSALAIALLKYLADHTLLTIATTHYGELKALKYQDERFENASVEFDDSTLSPTYRLLWGIPGRSNALTIARRLGLNPTIVDNAQQKLGGVSEDINQVIAGLESQRRQQEQKAQQAESLLQEAEHFYHEVSQKAAQLNAREKQLKLKQEKAVQSAINEAKGEIAQVIRQLTQQPKTGKNAQQATAAIDKIAQRRLPISTPKPKPGYQPQVGEKVRIPSLGQTAEVLTNPDEDGKVNVRFGLMKMTVSLGEIESLNGEKAQVPTKTKSNPVAAPKSPPPRVQTSQNTVDIRGSRVADAEFELETAISQAMASGILWIIHGKGTGRLRQGVQEFLGRHPQVERFELAPQNEGGSGVTIAYLQ